MKSLIYVEIINQISFTYQNKFISKFRKQVPEIETFDLDSHSDLSLFNHAIELIRKSDLCTIFIKAEKEASIGRVMLLLEEVLKNKEKSFVILSGENKHIEKISKQLNTFESNPDPDSVQRIIVNFFKNGQ